MTKEKNPPEQAERAPAEPEAETKSGDLLFPPDIDLLDQLQRLQAEFENFKKRSEREREEYRAFASVALIEQLLPIVDNFELALTHGKNGCLDGAFVKGVELVYAQLVEVLEHSHITIINPSGAFDPYRHEALLTEAKEGATKGTILEVLQKGYELNGRVLRPAKVKVAK